MVQKVYVQATKFIREIVQAKKRPTHRDVENFVEMLKSQGAPLNNLEYLEHELDNYVKNKVIYFQKKMNSSKEEEYKKIRILMKKFIEYYRDNINSKGH